MAEIQSLIGPIKQLLDGRFPSANLKLLPPIYINEVLSALPELGYEIVRAENRTDISLLYSDLETAINTNIEVVTDEGQTQVHVDIQQVLLSLTNQNWKIVKTS